MTLNIGINKTRTSKMEVIVYDPLDIWAMLLLFLVLKLSLSNSNDISLYVHCLQFEAEYRRFALKRDGPGGFQEFYRLLQTIHRIPGMDVLLGYADIHGDLLPINNDDNFHKAVSLANPLLRIIITKKG